jgi:uncharacterized repeat protein (TIGR01451 family)
MRYRLHTFLLSILFTSFTLYAQDWRLYSSDDAVEDFAAYKGDLWITAGSGLTRLNMNTLEKTSWNTVDSELPDYFSNKIAIDSAGQVWLAVYGNIHSKILRFDGQSFETITHINGREVNNLLDMEVTPDGMIWMMANTIPNTLYAYDQSQFTAIPLPGASFTYHRNSQSNICAGKNNHVWAILADSDSEKHFVGEYDGSEWVLHDLSAYQVVPEGEDAWALDQDGNIYLLCKDRDSPVLMQYDGQVWTVITLPQAAVGARYINEPLSIDDQNHIRILVDSSALLYHDGVQWSMIQLSTLGFTGSQPEKLLIDPQDRWWLIQEEETDYFPLSKLFHQNGSGTNSIDLSNSTLPTNELYSIYVDDLNNKWLRSIMGLIRFDGQSWTPISLPETLDLFDPIGSDGAGGIWMETYDNYIGHFDGLTASAIPVTNPSGIPVEWVEVFEVDNKGRMFAGGFESQIMVFDHGEISWLPQSIYYIDPNFSFPDYPNALAFTSDGTLYSLGSQLYRFEADSTWTPYPLWDEFSYASEMSIAPDSTVWVAELDLFPDGYIFHLFDGTSWSTFEVPYFSRSLPKWDSNGNPWFVTYEGLCQYANQTWFCYNRSNSPVIQEHISDFTIDAYDNIWIIQTNGGLLLFNPDDIVDENGEVLPVVGGSVFRDINQNGVFDDGDTPLAFQRELLLPDSVITFSRFDGQYRVSASAGPHEVKWIPRSNWHVDNTPESYDIEVSDQSVLHLDFALAPDQEKVDLNLFLTEGFPRCNTTSRYTLSFNNWGTMSEEMLITLVLDPEVTPMEINPVPDIITGDTLVWNVTNFLPFASSQIRLDLVLPGVEQQMISFKGYIDRIFNAEQERVDSILIMQEIRCAFDPNDKIARSVRSGSDGQVYPGDPIDYTIRFQNTGNDTAFQIVVRDTLDANLDAETMEILGASHPYEAFLKPDRTLEFRFYNILLPDSTTNELESHGFVSYRIKPKEDLPVPSIIHNTAHIYFDFNGSIQTNTVASELVELGTGTYDEAKVGTLIRAHPNPASKELWVEAISSDGLPVSYRLTGMNGQPLVSGILMPGERSLVPIGSLPSGLYILHADNGLVKGSVIVSKVE